MTKMEAERELTTLLKGLKDGSLRKDGGPNPMWAIERVVRLFFFVQDGRPLPVPAAEA